MKLAVKLVAIVLLEIVVLLAADGYIAVQREIQLFRDDLQRDAHWLGNVLRDVAARSWKTAGQQRALELIARANQDQELLNGDESEYSALVDAAQIGQVLTNLVTKRLTRKPTVWARRSWTSRSR